jgi:hypothetical protein
MNGFSGISSADRIFFVTRYHAREKPTPPLAGLTFNRQDDSRLFRPTGKTLIMPVKDASNDGLATFFARIWLAGIPVS